jgi:hypothetical protein
MPSALVGMMGAMNNLTTTISQNAMQSDQAAYTRSVKIISGASFLSSLEKAKLSKYYSSHPLECRALAVAEEVDPDFLKASLDLALQSLL